MNGLERHDEIPDKTFSELMEDSEDDEDAPDWVETQEEFEKEIEEFHTLAEVMYAAIVFGRMFEDDYITLREYMALTDYLEDIERDLDMYLV